MIIRTYACNDCGALFECEMENGDALDPDCPSCSVVMQWRPQSFNIGTVKSKAVDFTQKLIEEDYKLTNMRDGVREGESYYQPPPPKQAAEIEAETRRDIEITNQTGSLPPDLAAQVEHSKSVFFGGGGAMAPMVSAAKSVNALPGVIDGMAALHEDGKAGRLATKARVIARG